MSKSSIRAWHNFSVKKTFKKLNSSLAGLNFDEVEKRFKKFGPNRLPKKKPLSRLKIFLEQFRSPLVYILLIGGIITGLLGHYADTIVILLAVFLNAGVGYFQEKKANRALYKLRNILQVKAWVERGGQEEEVLQKDLVPGDVVYLRAGNKVPADVRIVEAHNLKINEASLTGEWVPANKRVKVMPKDTPMANRDNMAYMGTTIESGWGKGVVTATALKTEIGKVAGMIREKKERKTPYQRKLARFSKIVGLLIVFICIGIFIEGIVVGKSIITIFTTALAVAVAAIPEGLPVTMTVVLALGMQRILKRKGLVRKLASAETLGSTSIILTDKTGTLTKAKMRVSEVFAGKKEILSDNKTDKSLAREYAFKAAMFSNESFIENPEEPKTDWIIRGEPTEKAVLLAGIEAGFSKNELEKQEERIDRQPFDSYRKYSASLHKTKNKHTLYILGSPEDLLEKSAYLQTNDGIENLKLGEFKKIKERIEKLTAKGLRVIAACYKKPSTDEVENYKKIDDLVEDIVFVGLFAIHDPIRKKTKKVIKLCRQAGMRPIIVTGDHKLTAKVVGKKLGFKTKSENIIEGKDLNKLSKEEFQKKFKKIDIYARVEPAQKSQIIEAWQEKGEVVAMTGDGINDAPALKQADIGVAVGSGTDVAKEVSDLVLLTDNFNVIVAAIEEGRVIIDNIKKVITYLLSDSFTEVILISVSLFFGWPLPILAVQILWVNLIEDGPMSIALAFEKKEKDVMKQKPQNYSFRLLDKEMKVLIFFSGMITDLLLLVLFFVFFKFSNYDIAHIRSLVFAGLTIDSLFYIFSCKSLRRNIWHINPFSNKFLIWGWFFGVVALLSALYLPPLQSLLKTVGLGFFDWTIILGLGVVNIVLIEATKRWFITHKYDKQKIN